MALSPTFHTHLTNPMLDMVSRIDGEDVGGGFNPSAHIFIVIANRKVFKNRKVDEYVENRECECVICGKRFFSEKINAFTCGNKKCVDKNNYLRHREVYIENAKRWDNNNPKRRKVIAKKSCDKFRTEKRERWNKLMIEAYRRNKDKWQSRKSTGKLLKSVRYKNPLKKICPCGSIKNLEIHHEEYPPMTKGIKKAIDNGKIYYICRRCHNKRHGRETYVTE